MHKGIARCLIKFHKCIWKLWTSNLWTQLKWHPHNTDVVAFTCRGQS